ncbi:hypothetical protein N7563_21960 [Leclercia adecarboxylata ATCC 23216 = NBRC 102595]|nr:hypothetical protein [Leclercia adecarboxylata ATCC 23216 = NBRC 102595]
MSESLDLQQLLPLISSSQKVQRSWRKRTDFPRPSDDKRYDLAQCQTYLRFVYGHRQHEYCSVIVSMMGFAIRFEEAWMGLIEAPTQERRDRLKEAKLGVNTFFRFAEKNSLEACQEDKHGIPELLPALSKIHDTAQTYWGAAHLAGIDDLPAIARRHEQAVKATFSPVRSILRIYRAKTAELENLVNQRRIAWKLKSGK